MKLTALFWLFALLTPLACSSETKVDGGMGDGETDCVAGSTLLFSSPLSGDDVEYTIVVASDFGDSEAASPITCDVTTGSVPEDERTARCSGIADDIYDEIEGDTPPQLVFDGPAKKVEGLRWGAESDKATITVKKGTEVLFQGDVTFTAKICNDGFDDVEYQGATVDLSAGPGGDGGAGGEGGSN